MVTTEGAMTRRARLVVRESGTELIGISGRPVGVLEKAAEVSVHGEVGPYTIVSCEGRNGYVLTDNLTDHLSLLDEPAAGSERPSGESDSHHRWAGHIVLVLLSGVTAAAAVTAGAVLALG